MQLCFIMHVCLMFILIRNAGLSTQVTSLAKMHAYKVQTLKYLWSRGK